MRRSQRLIAAAVLIALSSALAGCSSSIYNWDPSDLLDWLDTKKKLPGERKPVFPDGVPGLEQGVPKDLYKDNVERQQQLDQQNAQATAAAPPPPPVEEPRSKKTAKSKARGKQPATAATGPAADPAAEEDGSTTAAPPAPKPKKIVRKRTTAPPPDQPAPAQSAQSGQPQPAPGSIPGATARRYRHALISFHPLRYQRRPRHPGVYSPELPLHHFRGTGAQSMIRKVGTGFSKRSCSTEKLERDEVIPL